ncbi:MAG TPA: MlaD family protein [Solirubrobacteraceae bacterium]|jgi:phospholipid/cholesterol/gamma-HCH transport system substrate-binding protein|nr:MlaD family protein [Solirubrobacteraceae bacterium]
MRWVVVGALALVVAIIAYLAFSSGGGASYSFELENDSQLVLGDQVQVGGVPVGSITGITVTSAPTYRALITIHVDSSLVPLHAGTTVQVRVPSLTTVAGRYVALTPGPNNRPALPDGAKLPSGSAQGTTDLDQLFDTLNPRTRKGLQELFVGTAEQYAGASTAAGISAEYFAPALAAGDHIFAELSRDQPTFTNFLVQSAKALTTIAAHSPELTSLISNANRALGALGAEQADLQRGVAQLPTALHQGNRAFAQLPSTFAALRQLVDVSKTDTKTLAPLFERLTPLVAAAQPTLHELSLALSRPGPSNDLTDVALALPGLARALANGSPSDIKALQEAVPITAFFGPYSPDLQGAVRDFGTSAGYSDANGNYARVSPVFNNFTLGAHNTLTPATAQQALQGLKTKQLLRCPGAGATPPPADASAPFTDSGQLGCDPSEVP